MFQKLLKRPLLLCIGLGLLLNIVLELCSRDRPLSFFAHVWNQPMAFIFNWTIAATTLSVSLFFKRKYFVISLIAIVWVGFSVANIVAVAQKSTPISPGDFLVMQISWDFIGKYVSAFGLVCMVLAVLGFGFLVSLLYRSAPQTTAKVAQACIAFTIMTLLAWVLVSDALGLGIEKERLNYYKDACREYGYVYSFLRSATERGMEEPEPEDPADFESIAEEIEGMGDETNNLRPNIIMLQLESFFDVNLLDKVSFSQNPVPTYTMLRNFNSHGKLSVPSIGAGTANTEFEILTQMNMDFFGSGEYPYSSVLKETAVESVPFDLKALGYNAAAIHSNNATFYDRQIVFSYMGFDTFVSKEYMADYEETSSGWVKDAVLTGEIEAVLDSTEGRDFIYTISVQGHGAYAKEKNPNALIKVSAPEKSEEDEAKIEYYVNQLKETDDFLYELVSVLEKRREPTMLVLFGDHMPPLDLDNEALMFGDIFETEYVIWANYDLPYEEEDLEAYQLSSYAMNMAGSVSGFMTELHINYREDPHYLEYLESAQYDIIYNEGKTTGEHYEPSKLKLGLRTEDRIIAVSSLSFKDDRLYIRGRNFTQSSEILINGRRRESEMHSSLLMSCEYVPEPGDSICITQVSDDGVELSYSNAIIWE